MRPQNKKETNAAIIGFLVLILVGLALFPICIYVEFWLGVRIVELILAGSYWAAFVWSAVFSLIPATGAFAKGFTGG